jgi:hypothetical protein
MRSNAGMANRQGDVDLHFGFAWLGLAWVAWLGLAWLGNEIHSFIRKGVPGNTHIKKGLIKTEDTTPDCPIT